MKEFSQCSFSIPNALISIGRATSAPFHFTGTVFAKVGWFKQAACLWSDPWINSAHNIKTINDIAFWATEIMLLVHNVDFMMLRLFLSQYFFFTSTWSSFDQLNWYCLQWRSSHHLSCPTNLLPTLPPSQLPKSTLGIHLLSIVLVPTRWLNLIGSYGTGCSFVCPLAR